MDLACRSSLWTAKDEQLVRDLVRTRIPTICPTASKTMLHVGGLPAKLGDALEQAIELGWPAAQFMPVELGLELQNEDGSSSVGAPRAVSCLKRASALRETNCLKHTEAFLEHTK